MMTRFAAVMAALALAATTAAFAQGAAPETIDATAVAEAPTEYARVAIVTELGTIEVDLDKTHAPITSANFLRYAAEKRFDGTVFYRVMRLDWGKPPSGLIQGGVQADPKRELPPIAHEPTNETGLSHTRGAISMARYAPGTAKGDFTIMLSNMTGLDAVPESDNPDLQPGFAAFGHVVSGMNVARAIYDVPLSETKGQGVMKGQIIEDPVKIISVRQIERPEDATPEPTGNADPNA